jgi:hypothetical protein
MLVQQRIADDQYQEALEISEQLARVDSSLLNQITKIFATSKDKRVKRGGCLFTAHLLRFSVVDQLSLFPGSEICDVAKITIPNILKLCLDKARFQWPWCYDTTLKYIGLLVAAGILLQRPGERGIYYLPLGPYVLLPQHASQHIEKLIRKRAKVSKSAAFQRTVEQCLAPPIPGTPEFVDSALKAGISLDAREIQHTLQEIQGILQSQQGVTLLPSTVREMLRVLTEHTPRILQKRTGTPITVSAQSLLLLTNSSKPGDSKHQNHNEQEATNGNDWSTSPRHELNLPCPELNESTMAGKSTTHGTDLRPDDYMVDSAFTDSVISLINKTNKTLSDITEFTIGGKQRRARAIESTAFPHMADSMSTNERQIGQVPEIPDLSEREIRYWAVKLSRDISGNDSKIKHYANLLRQSPEILHIAIVDALVRSHFPDPHRKQDRLEGGWITDRYKAYRAGNEVPPPEIYAWSQTGMTYRELEVTLSALAEFQDARNQPRMRPFPDNVPDQFIVDSCDVADFWLQEAGYGLEEMGYLFVRINEDLLTPRQYQQLRRRELQAMLESDPLLLQPETEDEWWAYFEWYRSHRYSPEEIPFLLENMSPVAKQKIREQVHQLEALLDLERYDVEVVLLPLRCGIPIERGLLIEVRNRLQPGKESRLLWSEEEVKRFVEELPLWQRSSKEEAETLLTDEASAASRCESRETPRADLCIGPYTVTFDETGVLLVHQQTYTRYYIDTGEPPNAVDFLRYPGHAVLAMLGGASEELDIYKIEPEKQHGRHRGANVPESLALHQ